MGFVGRALMQPRRFSLRVKIAFFFVLPIPQVKQPPFPAMKKIVAIV
jgi:hypothetical protein